MRAQALRTYEAVAPPQPPHPFKKQTVAAGAPHLDRVLHLDGPRGSRRAQQRLKQRNVCSIPARAPGRGQAVGEGESSSGDSAVSGGTASAAQRQQAAAAAAAAASWRHSHRLLLKLEVQHSFREGLERVGLVPAAARERGQSRLRTRCTREHSGTHTHTHARTHACTHARPRPNLHTPLHHCPPTHQPARPPPHRTCTASPRSSPSSSWPPGSPCCPPGTPATAAAR